MKAIKILAVMLLVGVISALVADNIYLHVLLEGQKAETNTANDVGLLKSRVEVLETRSSKIENELNGFERWSVASDKSILATVTKLEEWVATSSVQGKWNAYKRQLGDFESKMMERYNQMKESVRRKYHALTSDESSVPAGTAEVPPPDGKAGEARVVKLPGGVDLEMVYCPPCPSGFDMGDATGVDAEKTVHKVTLSQGFWMSKYTLTQRQWSALVAALELKDLLSENPSYYGPGGAGAAKVTGVETADFPVESVSWTDCNVLIDALNKAKCGYSFALPTEAQWEYACRAGTTTKYSFGDKFDGSNANCRVDGDFLSGKGRQALNRPAKVGSYPANAWGICDMHGNVWEWCADWYDENYYATSPSNDPRGPAKGKERTMRGGAAGGWAMSCTSAYRCGHDPDDRFKSVGVRLCCTVAR